MKIYLEDNPNGSGSIFLHDKGGAYGVWIALTKKGFPDHSKRLKLAEAIKTLIELETGVERKKTAKALILEASLDHAYDGIWNREAYEHSFSATGFREGAEWAIKNINDLT